MLKVDEKIVDALRRQFKEMDVDKSGDLDHRDLELLRRRLSYNQELHTRITSSSIQGAEETENTDDFDLWERRLAQMQSKVKEDPKTAKRVANSLSVSEEDISMPVTADNTRHGDNVSDD